MVLVLILYALLALTFVFAKQAVAYANPGFLIGFRMIIAGGVLLVYQYFTGKKHLIIAAADRWLFLKTAVFHIYLAFMLEFWALQYVSALKTIMIYSATPFVAAGLSYFLRGDRLSRNKILGMVVGVAGLLPVLSAAADGPLLSGCWLPSLPEIALCCSVVASAYAWFLFSDLMNKGYKLPFINGVTMLVGGLMSMATTLVTDGFVHGVAQWQPFLFWVGLLIITANLVVYNLYGWLLKRYSITFITFAGFLCPTFGAFYEWFFMGGRVTWHYLASLMLVTAGLTIFYRDELKSE